MSGIKTGQAEVWREYERAVSYNAGLGLYEQVQRNEDFYIGEQWKGLEAPDLDKPVMNILRRVVSFFISSIVSDDIGIHVSRFAAGEADRPVLRMLDGQFDRILELAEVKRKLRQMIRDAAVDGDGCLHYWFDPEAGGEAGGAQLTPGEIRAEVLENTNVHFGNPQLAEVEGQPYILLCYRRRVEDVRGQARAAGMPGWQAVCEDRDAQGVNAGEEAGKATVVRKYYKQGGRVWYTEVTAGAVVRPPTDTGYTRYPLAWMSWERVKNRFHGQAAITALIPNQIFVNKLYAMAMRHVSTMAFPKVVYNRALLPDGWDNRVGAAIGVVGDPRTAVMNGVRAPDMSAQVMQLIDRAMADTRDTMGASDASLGNVRPDNTSAIIATQKATSMPLELQKMAFYDFVEASVRIWLDMMGVNYGVRLVEMETPAGPDGQAGRQAVAFDFSRLRGMGLKLNVEIGAATYWSELMQVQTLDALYASHVLTDPVVYLENMPAGYVPGKQQIIESIQKSRQAQAGGLPGPPTGTGGALPPGLG